jgi:hypothetical protein
MWTALPRESDEAPRRRAGQATAVCTKALPRAEKSLKRHQPRRGTCLPGCPGNLRSILHSISKANMGVRLNHFPSTGFSADFVRTDAAAVRRLVTELMRSAKPLELSGLERYDRRCPR